MRYSHSKLAIFVIVCGLTGWGLSAVTLPYSTRPPITQPSLTKQPVPPKLAVAAPASKPKKRRAKVDTTCNPADLDCGYTRFLFQGDELVSIDKEAP